MEQNSILHTTLSLDSDIPLYAQLVGIIKRSISTGAPAGGRPAPQRGRALPLPEHQPQHRPSGHRRAGGRGSGGPQARPRHLRGRPRHQPPGCPLFLHHRGLLYGQGPSSTLVDFAVEVPKPTVCEKMELREGTPVYCFTCVRNVDGEPLILETSYYPQYIYPNLTRDMLQTHSFYSLLYHVGIVPFAADESYEAVILEDSCAALLGVPSGSCAFFHQRLTRTEDGRIYEYTRSYIRGDRVRLDVHMQKSGMNFVRTID